MYIKNIFDLNDAYIFNRVACLNEIYHTGLGVDFLLNIFLEMKVMKKVV